MRTQDGRITVGLHSQSSIREFFDNIQIAYNLSRNATEGERRIAGDRARKIALAFMQAPGEVAQERLKVRVHAFEMTYGTLPDTLSRLTGGVFRNIPQFDNGYAAAFATATLEPGTDYFEIMNIINGIKWEKIPEGDKVKLSKISATIERFYLEKFGAAIGWSDRFIKYSGYAGQVINWMTEVRDSYYLNKAENYYGLLGAAATTSLYLNYDATGADQLNKDINTLNSLGLALKTAMKGKSIVVSEILVYHKSDMTVRFKAAANAINRLNQTTTLGYNFRFIETDIAATGWPTLGTDVVAVVPGRKILSAQDGPDMESYSDTDILSLEYQNSFFSWYTGAIGDSTQVKGAHFA